MATIQNDEVYHEILEKTQQAFEKTVTGIGRLGHHYDLVEMLDRHCKARTNRGSCVTTALFHLNQYEQENGRPITRPQDLL